MRDTILVCSREFPNKATISAILLLYTCVYTTIYGLRNDGVSNNARINDRNFVVSPNDLRKKTLDCYWSDFILTL